MTLFAALRSLRSPRSSSTLVMCTRLSPLPRWLSCGCRFSDQVTNTEDK